MRIIPGLITLTFLLLHGSGSLIAQSMTLSGTVATLNENRPLPGSNILISETGTGTIADNEGRFSVSLPPAIYTIRISHIGFESQQTTVDLTSDQSIHILLKAVVYREKDVVITGKRDLANTDVQVIERKDIRKMPTLYSDVLRTVQILPGVTTNNELSTTYHVRGGNYNENLVYLNGYEIFRPFLLRQGIEENQSLINPDLVKDLKFYNGAFESRLGDKMSSALEVTYLSPEKDNLSGTVRADLLNLGLSLKDVSGKLAWAGGIRYAYPGLFLTRLQTSGDYKPVYSDAQFLANYPVSSKENLQLFIVYAENRYDLTPSQWVGHFREFGGADFSAVTIDYDGYRNYLFNTGLAALRYSSKLTDKSDWNLSAAYFMMSEKENYDLSSDYYYSPDAERIESGKEYLKRRTEKGISSLKSGIYEINSSIRIENRVHSISSGIGIRYTSLRGNLNESFFETGEESLLERPFSDQYESNFSFLFLSGYLQDVIRLSDSWELNTGARIFYNNFNSEFRFSPRFSVSFFPSDNHVLKLSSGFYYQPPHYHEFRNKTVAESKTLKSQEAIHFVLGWEHKFNSKMKFLAQVYYKMLDDLIPYDSDQMRIVYGDKNNMEGFARGIDLQFQGEVVEFMQSWFSYSYLDTQERLKQSGTSYNRRLTDQTHTLSIFLQDRIPKRQNWQSHFRLIFGSGFLYNERKLSTDENGNIFIETDPSRRNEYLMYFRADMGLTASFNLGKTSDLLVTAEVLNIFNHYNIAGYNWVQVFRNVQYPVRVPQIYSKRFFNIGAELAF